MEKFIVALMVAFLSLSSLSSVSAHPHHDEDDDHKYSVREEVAISKKALKK